MGAFVNGKNAPGKGRPEPILLAPGLGFEPRLPDPESGVLPLDDPGKLSF